MANRAAGKGYENEAFYENMKFKFLGIENIHVMRSSLQKLIESKAIYTFKTELFSNVSHQTCLACEQKSLTMGGFLNSLESSGWLKHIRAILETSR